VVGLPQSLSKIFNGAEIQNILSLLKAEKIASIDDLFNSDLDTQQSLDRYQLLKPSEQVQVLSVPQDKIIIYNHLEFNWNLSNKKALFFNIQAYYQARNERYEKYLPVTFHIQEVNDKQYKAFLEYYNFKARQLELKEKESGKLCKKKQRNIWILKPGEITNRGSGIEVFSDINEIIKVLSEPLFHRNGMPQTFILQEYIIEPLLYDKRKFDIRCFILITSINGLLKGYWYQDGYIRTSSSEFTLKNL